MPAYLTTAKRDEIRTAVKRNPSIANADDTRLNDLIDRAAEFVVKEANLPRYPELSQGYAQSAASATEDLRTLDSNEIWLSINGSPREVVELTLSACDTGANTATELQAKIRANAEDGFDEVSVAFSGGVYTITSGRYGEHSSVNVLFYEETKHVAQAMKLSPAYGGIEVPGSDAGSEVDTILESLTEVFFRKEDLEGVASAGVPGGMNVSFHELDPVVRKQINRLQRWF